MMTEDNILKVQAYADGELPDSQRSEVESMMAADSELRDVYEALRSERTWLRENEPDRCVREPRGFYWSRIEKGIVHADEGAALGRNPEGNLPGFWLRWVLPAAGVAALLCVAMVVQFGGSENTLGQAQKASSYHEVDSPLDSGSLITFRSESEGVTVFWISSD